PGCAPPGHRNPSQQRAQPLPDRGGVRDRGDHRSPRHSPAALRLGFARLRERGDATGRQNPWDAAMKRRTTPVLTHALILPVGLLVAIGALAADAVLVEDWKEHKLGATGPPAGWEKQTWGSPRYDLFSVVEDGGYRALHLKSEGSSSNISKSIKGQ